ncbi:MAG: transport-associated protein [Candidatus Solibacter sp.]|jgi:hyperosmotically inducible protein|nr:transport-associated protein [Candidatus Solibacter sp.]
MLNVFPSKTSTRIAAVGAVVFLAAGLLTAPSTFAAKRDKNHRDAFMRGDTDEEELAKKVRHELVMLPYYGVFDDLAFKLEGNTVILLGAVTRPTLKSDAEAVVKRIPGVEKVINQIEVLPPSPMDDRIRMAAYRAIYGDPALSTRYGYRALPSIHIIVKNGNITLRGVVANEFDKNLVNTRVNSIPGVFSVKNELEVEDGA